MGNKRTSVLAGNTSRKLALYLFVAIPLGNLLCELGNLLAGSLGLKVHYFNIWFLVIGVLGMCCFGFALFRRRNMGNSSVVDEIK